VRLTLKIILESKFSDVQTQYNLDQNIVLQVYLGDPDSL